MCQAWGAVPWLKIAIIVAIIWGAQAGTSATVEFVEDAYEAWELDSPHPLPRRSDYESIPGIGPVMRVIYDVGDVAKVNSGFVVRYARFIPWVAATPALMALAPAAALPMIKGLWMAKSAALSLAPMVVPMR